MVLRITSNYVTNSMWLLQVTYDLRSLCAEKEMLFILVTSHIFFRGLESWLLETDCILEVLNVGSCFRIRTWVEDTAVWEIRSSSRLPFILTMTVIDEPGTALRILCTLYLNLPNSSMKCGDCYSRVTDADTGLWWGSVGTIPTGFHPKSLPIPGLLCYFETADLLHKKLLEIILN